MAAAADEPAARLWSIDDIFLFLPFVYLFDHFDESRLHVFVGEGARLLEEYSFVFGEFPCLHRVHLLPVPQVYLIRHQSNHHIWTRLLSDRFNPPSHVAVSLLFGDVIHH